MTETDWTPWKMTTFGFLLVGATALVATLVMGYRDDREDVEQSKATSRANTSTRKALVPSQIDVEACQAYAQQRAEDKTMSVVKDVAIGGGVGSGVDTTADGGSGAGNGVAIGGPAGVTAGTLHRLNDTQQHDAQYQAAYRSCMRQKGY